jgi:50S ribosomal protein L16 3-hydroxylase
MQERLPGGFPVGEFLCRHWQKKPLLVRGALPQCSAWLARRDLFSLARRADVESRLVERRGARWRVERGPLAAARLARLPRRNWTLLVNGVDLHLRQAENLLRSFSFIPQARLDDVMASYAAPGGGVGPHWDSYDVFLLQGRGRRRWRLARARRFAAVGRAPLRLIAGFRPDTEILAEPGDLLYLPPGWGHDGIALEPCITYSVGFRAPGGAELAAAFLDYLHERGLPDAVYRDPPLAPARRPGAIPPPMIEFAARVLDRVRWTRADARRFLGRHLSTPKPHLAFRAARGRFSLARRAVRLDPGTQLLYSGREFYVNGEALMLPPRQARALRALADRRRAQGPALARAGLRNLIRRWYRLGYLDLERIA